MASVGDHDGAWHLHLIKLGEQEASARPKLLSPALAAKEGLRAKQVACRAPVLSLVSTSAPAPGTSREQM